MLGHFEVIEKGWLLVVGLILDFFQLEGQFVLDLLGLFELLDEVGLFHGQLVEVGLAFLANPLVQELHSRE